MGLYARFDRFQQRHAWLGFPWATLQKYGEDQGGYLAATITYYGFFAIFPLLLVFTTVLGYVLRNHPHLQERIVDSVLAQFPIIGHEPLRHLKGNGVALVLGAVTAIWAGMGAVLACQNAMNGLWGVPFRARPDFLRARARALLLLAVLGTATLATTVLAALGTVGASYGIGWKVGVIALTTAVNFVIFWVAFRVLTAREVTWRQLRGGAVAAAVLYEGLQLLGGYYVAHVLRNASNVYGTFGAVIGLLSWIYLAAHILLLAAEGNVVATRRLWPRSFSLVFQRPPTEADRRALAQRARVEERRADQQIEVQVGSEPPDGV